MFKKILIAVGAAIALFIAGLFAGSKRSGGSDSGGIADAIDREGKFQDGIADAQDSESEHQAGIADLENRVNETGTGISNLEDRIADTDSLAERLKKQNGLE